MGIEPTGNPVDIAVNAVHRIEVGNTVEEWQVVDRLAILEQLGVVEGSSGADPS